MNYNISYEAIDACGNQENRTPAKDQHSPFSSRKLLKRQDCCRHWERYTFLDSVSYATEDSLIKTSLLSQADWKRITLLKYVSRIH